MKHQNCSAKSNTKFVLSVSVTCERDIEYERAGGHFLAEFLPVGFFPIGFFSLTGHLSIGLLQKGLFGTVLLPTRLLNESCGKKSGGQKFNSL